MMTCILCKKPTEGTLGPSKTRVPLCPDCTPDRNQRTMPDYTNWKDSHRICPDCGGRKGWDSKRCNGCNIKRMKKIDPATCVCPKCQGPKEPTSKTCLSCYKIRNQKAPDPLENSKEDQAHQEKTP